MLPNIVQKLSYARLAYSLQLARHSVSCNSPFIVSFPFIRRYASTHFAPLPPDISSLETPNDMKSARQWAETFRKASIPRETVEMTFSRSSGPGGQNVNKVNTKSTVKCPLHSSFIPSWARQVLRRNPAYVASSDCLLVTSTVYRSQAQNIDDCLRKLHSIIVTASLANVKNETSAEQKKKVETFKRADKARRRREKEYRSHTKQLRKGNRD